jgi:hypothetical protein
MKKLSLAFILLLGAFAVSAQSRPSINIVNNTGYTIYELYVSPSESDEWGEDILGETVLENGNSFTIQLPSPLNQVSVYDIGAEDEDGDAYIKWELTVTNNARIVFTLEDLEDSGSE